jgi:crotonobetainyl-CoA:carnitine CoA-transferase CaiB-like acyl-CoA transferase
VALLLANNTPCVKSTKSSPNSELTARHIVRNGTIADRDDIKVLGPAIKMSGLRGDEIPPHVPGLGEHTAEVLQRLGISANELDALRHDGIV